MDAAEAVDVSSAAPAMDEDAIMAALGGVETEQPKPKAAEDAPVLEEGTVQEEDQAPPEGEEVAADAGADEPEGDEADAKPVDDGILFLDDDDTDAAAKADAAIEKAKAERGQESALVTHWQAQAQMAGEQNEQLQQQVQHMQSFIAQMRGPTEPDPDMLVQDSDKYDPDAYHSQMAVYRKHSAAQQQAQAATSQREQAEQAKFLAERDTQLRAELPILFDSSGAVKTEVIARMKAEAIKGGYSERDFALMSVFQAKTLFESLQWQAAQRQRKKAKTAPKGSPQVRQSRRGAPAPSENDAAQRFLANPNDEDALLGALSFD